MNLTEANMTSSRCSVDSPSSIEELHSLMVRDLTKPGADIRAEMTPKKWGALLVSMGRCIEAGKHLDVIKKFVVYNKNDEFLNCAPPQQVPHLDDDKWNLIHHAIGIAGEAAEILEAVYRMVETGSLDIENAIEELGDSEFHHEGFRDTIQTTREEVLLHNRNKLVGAPNARYADGKYSDKAAQDRADKE